MNESLVLQVLGHPWAVSTKLEIWLGDVAKGQEVNINKAYFMKVGEFSLESNEDNDYTARQLQCIEVQVTFLALHSEPR